MNREMVEWILATMIGPAVIYLLLRHHWIVSNDTDYLTIGFLELIGIVVMVWRLN